MCFDRRAYNRHVIGGRIFDFDHQVWIAQIDGVGTPIVDMHGEIEALKAWARIRRSHANRHQGGLGQRPSDVGRTISYVG